MLDNVDEQVSAQVHDSPLGSLHSSGLQGVFSSSDRAHHKTIRPDKEYTLTLGIVDPDDEAIFEALVNALVLEGDSLRLTDGVLRIESFESENATHEMLLERAAAMDDPTLDIEFVTATCIEEAGDVTTMFPHRVPVFKSLLGKWNKTAPDELELDLSRETIAASVIEKPDARAYDTHSVLVNRVENENGQNRNLFRQGFTGRVAYAFKDASESMRNALATLALFGEFSGVGSAVARGCGAMEVELE
ncbi:CRISPR system precrRNA processing endoribonuclease RAMP protein Cas6 [Halococcus thailandensis]|uniref:CRISPR system precrRNA processing endoribonuclease RAMP protein Cas6 n=1 Tax=Halococcus thailandensis TaxID=335952 RepID=UPI001F4C84C2|nr:CRISPR system precrRNA processing endoribonuclease RAMP protein Cas6 [Halococcus thailandensis]